VISIPLALCPLLPFNRLGPLRSPDPLALPPLLRSSHLLLHELAVLHSSSLLFPLIIA